MLNDALNPFVRLKPISHTISLYASGRRRLCSPLILKRVLAHTSPPKQISRATSTNLTTLRQIDNHRNHGYVLPGFVVQMDVLHLSSSVFDVERLRVLRPRSRQSAKQFVSQDQIQMHASGRPVSLQCFSRSIDFELLSGDLGCLRSSLSRKTKCKEHGRSKADGGML